MSATAGDQPKQNMLTKSGVPECLRVGSEHSTIMMLDEAWAEPPTASFGANAMHAHLPSPIMSGPGPAPQVPLACRSNNQTPNQPKSPDLMPGSPMPSGVPETASCHSSSQFHAGNQSTKASADGKTPAPCSLRDAREIPSLQPTQTTACESPRICDIASVDAHTTAASASPEPATILRRSRNRRC